MKDLFGDTCPCCGQAIQTAAQTPFDAFWDNVPCKIGKVPAQKAWGKLTPGERQAASDSVRGFYEAWRRANPDAAWLHPSTYLNNKRWQDEMGGPKPVTTDDKLRFVAQTIRKGQRFLCTDISASAARECIARGLVTDAQCRAVGVL